jgi:diguanylate cyclase (GGDEF)-like protein
MRLARGLWPHLSGSSWVWLLTGLVAAMAVATYLLGVRPLGPLELGFRLPWWALGAMFYVAELGVVHLRFRRDAYSFSMSEIPLVLGLFFADPAAIVPAYLLGSLLALSIHRRQPPLKLCFNLSQFVLQASIATVVFHRIVVLGDPIGPAGWIGAFVGTQVTVWAAALLINWAIHLSGDRVPARTAWRALGLGILATAMNASLGLVGVTILQGRPSAAWLAIVPPVVLFIAYTAYSSKRRDHERLQLLYEATRALHESPDIESVTATAAMQARTLLDAQFSEVVLLPPNAQDAAFSTQLGPGDHMGIMEPTTFDPPEPVRRQLLIERRAVVLPRPIQARLAGGFVARRSLKDAAMAPLLGNGGVLGVMVVGNRLGDVSTFEDQDLKLLETLAKHVGVALENGRLEDSLAQLTELKEELRHQAFHDSLTGLPNRTLFTERVAFSVTRQGRVQQPLAVLFLDLDDFKTINDSLGHSVGDQVLVTVADRLRRCLRPTDTVARLGGDEFGILLDDMSEPRDALLAAERIMASLNVPATIDGREVSIRGSLGITLDGHGDDADTLLRNADLAMYTAKRRGKGRYQVFEENMHTEMVERLELTAHIRGGLERDQFSIHYQPIVHLDTGRIAGVEALARWNHPTRGLLRPAEFIPQAEETGLIIPLGRSILEEASHRARAWQQEMDVDECFALSVNLSPKQLLDPDLVKHVADALAGSALDPCSLILEITEDVFMQEAEGTMMRLRELKDLGVRLAIDDFGTGYSSLSYLERFPVDMLKIAKPFVDGLAKGAQESPLVEAVIRIGDALGLETVAEGIERAEQWDRLKDLHCEQGQGFYFARPLEDGRVKGFLAGNTDPSPDPSPNPSLDLVAEAG